MSVEHTHAVILGDNRENAQDHIAALGLTAIPTEEEEY